MTHKNQQAYRADRRGQGNGMNKKRLNKISWEACVFDVCVCVQRLSTQLRSIFESMFPRTKHRQTIPIPNIGISKHFMSSK